MATDAKTEGTPDSSLSSMQLCDKIHSQLESIVKGTSDMDYKNESQVSNTFESLYWQMGLLKSKLEEESKNENTMDESDESNEFKMPSAQSKMIRTETQNLPRELMKEGFVEKRGEGPLKGWKKRYLQLQTNKTIDYYVDSTLKDLKGTIYLSKSNIKSDKFENGIEINYNVNFGFNIHTMNRVWQFKVESTTSRAQWVQALNDCIQQKGLTYSKGRRQTELNKSTKNNSNDNNNNNLLNSPPTKAQRSTSNSLSLLGDAGNNEFLQGIEKDLNKVQTAKHEHVTLDDANSTKEFNVPQRKFLNLESNMSDENNPTQQLRNDSIDI